MDTNLTEVYDTTANVDVNKQISYQENMDFSQENYSTDSQIATDELHLQEGDHYNVQHETGTYNPPDQQIVYQDPQLENVSNEAFIPIQETDVQNSYIPEQLSQVKQSGDFTNNRVNEDQIVETVEIKAANENGSEDTLGDDNNENLTEVPLESNNDIIDKTKDNGTNLINQTPESSINPTENTTDSGLDSTDPIDTYNDDSINTNTIESSIDQVESIVEDTVSEMCLTEHTKNGSDSVNETLKNKNSVEMQQVVENNTGNEELSIIENNAETSEEISIVEDNTEASEEIPIIEDNAEASQEVPIIEDNAESSQEIINLEIEEATILESDKEAEAVTIVENIELRAYDESVGTKDHYVVIETSSSEDIQDIQERSDIQLVEVYEDNSMEKQDKVAQKKPRRTRKPIHNLPMHLIGHDISKPVENVPNGRALPKPRLGVKLPYLNLTSQIVSKAELEEEIIERCRAKEQSNEKQENKFARGLTERLANKIVPEENRKNISSKGNNKKADNKQVKDVKPEPVSSNVSSNLTTTNESKIQNNDDLLAILEGDGEEILEVKKVQDNEMDDSNLKSIEREIALQQLQELPRQLPKERIIKPRYPKTEIRNKTTNSSSKTVTPKSNSPVKPDTPSKPDAAPKLDTSPAKKSTVNIDLDLPSPVKKPVEVEPQVKVNMVLKTYSRKRKPSDIPEFESPSPKRSTLEDPDLNDIFENKTDPLALPTDVYVTKSSRVIKKKVIWDPDDDQYSKGQKTPSKVSDATKVTTPKAVKPVASEKQDKSEKKSAPSPAEKNKESKEKPSEKTEKVTPKKIVTKTKTPPKSKRGLSEVDRLLMDEGAIKMLYELKGSDEHTQKKKKDVYSVEKAEKEILKRANLLKNDLVQNTSNESPKSLRKKETLSTISPNVKPPPPILERKLSKDSTRSSVHTPPRSPTFFSSQPSMLIRRRSSSSISSDEDVEVNKSLKSSKAKKQKKNATSENDSNVKESKENSTDSTPKAIKGTQYKSFTMKRSGKHVSIDLHYNKEKCYFTAEVLGELTAALKRLEKDKDCNVVSLTSTSKAFCLGLDYASLVTDNKKERTEKATSLAESVRNFLECLLQFPKIIVAGIQSDCVGLGVTMLPLFDTVIASDKATFRTPYASLGCMGEASFLLSYAHLNSCGLAAELLYANQLLKADEAFKRGLISNLCWPEKYQDTLNHFVTSVAQGSRQSLETTKRQLLANTQAQIKAAINSEMEILVQHWTSQECQENFSKIEI